MKCRNCGAKIKADELRCPYCSYQNERAANRRYMGKLQEIHSGMARLSEQPKKTLKYEIAVTMIITVAAVALAITYGFLWDAFTRGNSAVDIRRMNQNTQEEIEWKEENFPILDALYEEQKYEELLELYNEKYLASIGYIYRWEHYALIEALRDHEDVLEFEALAESGEEDEPGEYEIRYALIGALKLIYSYDEEKNTYDTLELVEEDKALIEEMGENAQVIMEKYLKLLPEDLDEIYAVVGDDGYVSYSDCQEIADELYQELFAGKEEQ